MCRPSTVTDDWVVKGCHIHVDGVEPCGQHIPLTTLTVSFLRKFSDPHRTLSFSKRPERRGVSVCPIQMFEPVGGEHWSTLWISSVAFLESRRTKQMVVNTSSFA